MLVIEIITVTHEFREHCVELVQVLFHLLPVQIVGETDEKFASVASMSAAVTIFDLASNSYLARIVINEIVGSFHTLMIESL